MSKSLRMYKYLEEKSNAHYHMIYDAGDVSVVLEEKPGKPKYLEIVFNAADGTPGILGISGEKAIMKFVMAILEVPIAMYASETEETVQ